MEGREAPRRWEGAVTDTRGRGLRRAGMGLGVIGE